VLRFADAVRRAPDCARRCRRAGCRLASDCRAARRRLASRARGRELRRTRIAGGCGGRLRRSCRTPRVAPGVGRASAALRASDGRAPRRALRTGERRASDGRAPRCALRTAEREGCPTCSLGVGEGCPAPSEGRRQVIAPPHSIDRCVVVPRRLFDVRCSLFRRAALRSRVRRAADCAPRTAAANCRPFRVRHAPKVAHDGPEETPAPCIGNHWPPDSCIAGRLARRPHAAPHAGCDRAVATVARLAVLPAEHAPIGPALSFLARSVAPFPKATAAQSASSGRSARWVGWLRWVGSVFAIAGCSRSAAVRAVRARRPRPVR